MLEQVDFCYLNSKSSRKKLVRTLFNVPRTSLELIPYYSRMIATLSTCMKDVTPMILQLLEEEFNFLMNKKVIFPLYLSKSCDVEDTFVVMIDIKSVANLGLLCLYLCNLLLKL
jgi:hypothetical protein